MGKSALVTVSTWLLGTYRFAHTSVEKHVINALRVCQSRKRVCSNCFTCRNVNLGFWRLDNNDWFSHKCCRVRHNLDLLLPSRARCGLWNTRTRTLHSCCFCQSRHVHTRKLYNLCYYFRDNDTDTGTDAFLCLPRMQTDA